MTAIARSDDLRRENQRRILAALRAEQPLSRTELSAATGLSASTVTAIASGLLERNILIEAQRPKEMENEGPAARGRPQVALALNPSAATIGALRMSLNQLSAALVDYSGKVLIEKSEAIASQSAHRDDFGKRLEALFRSAIAEFGPSAGPAGSLALTIQGVTDAQGMRMKWSPITPHRDLDIGHYLADRFGVPVSLANDANMIATALRWEAPGSYSDSFAAVLLSHGIGMGLFLNGQLFNGILSSAAEFGHMCHIPNGALCRCGRHGCVEAYAGDYAIWRRVMNADPKTMPDVEINTKVMENLANRAKAGDQNAVAAYVEAAEAIGHGLRSLFALLDPFPVAFVGSGTLAFELMEPTIRTSLGRKGIGLSYADTEFRCYEDDSELSRKGTIITALTALDRTIQSGRENSGGPIEKLA